MSYVFLQYETCDQPAIMLRNWDIQDKKMFQLNTSSFIQPIRFLKSAVHNFRQ